MSEKPERIDDAPEYARTMTTIAGALDEMFNGKGKDRKTGFVLMVFPFGGLGEVVISNGPDREGVVALMRDMIARFEAGNDGVRMSS